MQTEYATDACMQAHLADPDFDYAEAVNWALRLLAQGVETEDLLILAAISPPFTRDEVLPYLRAALRSRGLAELEGEDADWALIHCHAAAIVQGRAVREHLHKLYWLHLERGEKYGLETFMHLEYEWEDLEYGDTYIKDLTLDTVEAVVKDEARKWIDRYIHGNEDAEAPRYPQPQAPTPTPPPEPTPSRWRRFWEWLVSGD